MIIEVKDPAIEQLKQLALKDHEGIRILTDEEVGCALYVDFALVIDKKQDTDVVINSGGVDFLLSEQARKNLPEKLYLTHTGSGYKLYSAEEFLQTDIQIK